MPENVRIVTALIMERPLCLRCLAEKAGTSMVFIRAALVRIGSALKLHRPKNRRCHACGDLGPVVFVDRPGVPAKARRG